MKQHLAHIALLVYDYDEAIRFFTGNLDFKLLEDTELSPGKRWVLVAPPGSQECSLLLAKAADDNQKAQVGNQSGGRVFLFLYTDNFERDYRRYREKGVRFVREPETHGYGTVAVFEDLYGNRWDLLEPSTDKRG